MHSRFDTFIALMEAELKAFKPNLSSEVIQGLITAVIIDNRLPEHIIANQNERDVRKGKSKSQKRK